MKTRSLIGIVLTALLVGACTGSADTRVGQSGLAAEQFEPGQGFNLGGRTPRGVENDRDEPMSSFRPAEIASMLLVFNEGEVAQARVARERARSEAVRGFAALMIEDHSEAAEHLRSGPLARLGASDRDATARILARHGDLITRDLEADSDDLFDLAYMTSQLSEHAKLLGLIENALLPEGAHQRRGERGLPPPDEVRSEELTRELMQTRELVARHLRQALRVHVQLRHEQLSDSGG